MPSLWPCTRVDDELDVGFLTDRDRPWLRDLVAFAHRADGLARAELERAVWALPVDARAGAKFGPVRRLLLRFARPAPSRDAQLVRVREALFANAETEGVECALARARDELGLAGGDLRRILFADLASSQRVDWPRELTAERLALAANRAQVQSLLVSAASARLRLYGASRAVLRTAWLHGAGFAVERAARSPLDDVVLAWGAGEGLSRRARRRGLAAVLPVLPWARRYALEVLLEAPTGRETEPLCLRLGSLDPVLPGPEPRTFDSALEVALARDLARLARDAEVVREPTPVVVDSRLVFPDFAVRLPSQAAWFVEVAGLRDVAALPTKIAALLACDRLVLCLPARAAASMPSHPRVVPFARRVDAAVLLARLRALDAPRSA